MAKFRIAIDAAVLRQGQANEWKDGDTLFLTVNVWRQAAENVAESMTRGTRAIVQGRLRQRSYETKEGEKRTVYEIEADEVGVSLRNASAKVTKAARASSGNGEQRQDQGDPWAGKDSGYYRRAALLRHGRLAPALAADAGAGASASQWMNEASTTRRAGSTRICLTPFSLHYFHFITFQGSAMK